MYNVIDTYYGGLISTQAVAALALSFPVFFLIIAVGSGISTGATALIANAIGEGRKKLAKLYTAQALSFGVILAFFLTFIGLFIAEPLFRFLGAEGTYLKFALSYIHVIFYGTIFFLLSYISNASLQASGDTKTFRNVLIVGFLANLVLDPWFMYGGFGLRPMGLKGIALATILIQAAGALFMLFRVFRSGLLCKESLHMFIPQKKIFKDLVHQGGPASLNMMSVALGIFVITYFVGLFGKEAVAAYGIATRIEQIALLPSIGINIATLTLIGQNNGAKKFARVRMIHEKAIKYGLLIMTVGALGIFCFPQQLMKIFSTDPPVVQIGSYYLRIAATIFWAYALLFINTSVLQGLKKPLFALWMGLYRQIIGAIAFFYLFTTIFDLGIKGIWLGVFLINWSGALVTIWYVKKTMRKECHL